MYSMFFYTILIILIFTLVIRFMWPILWILLIAYLIYYIYRLYKYRQLTKEMRQAEQTFKEEWQKATSSDAYQSRRQSQRPDVIDADFTVKDEDHTNNHE